tara:strand:+ start:294 stop:716 length:423 start_codon:yes stop_codon:yes gene_type:complete
MALVDVDGNPIKATVDESKLPTVEEILKDPITKKFVFLTSETYPNQTCIGLTSETDYHGVVYRYGEVTLPDESKLDANNNLNLKFKYDILENNGIPREKFGDEFFKLIGDILYHIIITQAEDSTSEPINRTNNAEQPSNQ